IVSPAQIAKLDPKITVEAAGAAYFSQDCCLDPIRLMAALVETLKRMGVEFVWDSAVAGWISGAGGIKAIMTRSGEFKADEFVLAAGSSSPSVIRDLRLPLPMRAGKGYSFEVTNPPEMPEICSILKEARIAVTPMGSSLRFAGTMEINGLDYSVNG